MSIKNGRYSLADVQGATFIPKKGGLPTEVTVISVAYGELPPTQGELSRNVYAQPMRFRFVTFNYVWDNQVMTASLKWHKFLTDYVRKDWHEYWVLNGKP